jgi:Ca2+/Na+ antiporter
MNKKVILCVLVLLFLNSVIVPNFASAMGQSSTISDSAGWGLLAGFIVVLGIVYYYNKHSKEPKEEKKEDKLTKKKVEGRLTPSGELVLFRW